MTRTKPLLWLFAVMIGGASLVGAPAAAAASHAACPTNAYENVDYQCVPRPQQADTPPPDASARCADGTYSYSKHRRGTCSKHGGVSEWLADIPS